MGVAGVGWIAAIIIGGLAGWIASRIMKTDTGIFLNICLLYTSDAAGPFVLNFWLYRLIARTRAIRMQAPKRPAIR